MRTQMRTQLKINGELKDVEIKNGEITIIKPEKKATGWERAKPGEWQRYIDSYNIKSSTEDCLKEDDELYKKANYFTSQKLAENISRMQTLQRQMFRWQAENDIPINLNSGNKAKYFKAKYFIVYDLDNNGFDVCSIYTKLHSFLPYFSSRNKAIECITEFENELRWLFTEFRWRMDGE